MYLRVAFTLQLDASDKFLAVAKSEYGLYADAELEVMVLHYDYEREPHHPYPEAHFQLSGRSAPLNEIAKRAGVRKELKDFHFPVGGRRFRPTLEDLIEFLVVEGLAEGHQNRHEVVEQHRARWDERQLRAAIRRMPEVARDALAALARGEG